MPTDTSNAPLDQWVWRYCLVVPAELVPTDGSVIYVYAERWYEEPAPRGWNGGTLRRNKLVNVLDAIVEATALNNTLCGD